MTNNIKGTIAFIGGSQEQTIKQIAKRMGYKVLFDNAKRPKRAKYQTMIDKADSIVILTGACSHRAMWLIKELAKKSGKPVAYHKNSFGISGAIYLGISAMEKKKELEQLQTII